MTRTKKLRIEEVSKLPNVFSFKHGNSLENILNFFKNNNPLSIEIGCGQGDYSYELAKIFPDKNFIGIDLKGARIHTAAKRALKDSSANVCFYYGRAEEIIQVLKPNTIEQIFIPFPDPHIKRKNVNKRLVSDEFLLLYKRVLKKDGTVQLKTDDTRIYNSALNSITRIGGKIIFAEDKIDIEKLSAAPDYILTKYEKYYLKEGRDIKLIQFSF